MIAPSSWFVVLQLLVKARLTVSIHHPTTFPSLFEATSCAGSLSRVCTSGAVQPLLLTLNQCHTSFGMALKRTMKHPLLGVSAASCHCLDENCIRMRSSIPGVNSTQSRSSGQEPRPQGSGDLVQGERSFFSAIHVCRGDLGKNHIGARPVNAPPNRR
ncbi:hypothetical protein QR685DRAFT_178976 [Neurospora intermedia]|uniref:Secreted protein n=1 Tax=Neurospora intermedia TaxID=5142 RepID=A0ABR3DLL3_NEUIN